MAILPLNIFESAYPVVERMVNRVGCILPPLGVIDTGRVFRDIRQLGTVIDMYMFLLLDAEVCLCGAS